MYRPPGTNGQFLKEFSGFLSSTLKLSRLVVIGDSNIHIDDDSALFARGFVFFSIIDSFHFTQHVSGPAHTKGHTLVPLSFSDVFHLVLPVSNDVDLFNSHCLSILDNICPVKSRLAPVLKSFPWINESICCLKRACGKVEHLWRKTQLQVHLLHLKDLLASLNTSV